MQPPLSVPDHDHSSPGKGLVSVLVPVFRNEMHLNALYERLASAMAPNWPEFELIFVNDSPPDKSWSVIHELCKRDPRVKGICLSRNFGQHPAIAAALEYASGTYFVLMDADLQDPPEEVPRLLENIQANDVDIVYTSKISDDKSFLHHLTSRLFHLIFARLTGATHTENIGTFRVFNRAVHRALLQHPEREIVYGPLMHSLGFRSSAITVHRAAREHSKSSYTFWKRMTLAINTLISYSTLPYRVMMTMGVVLTAISLIYALVVVVQRVFFGVALPPGLTILFLFQLLTLGFLLGSIGILGLYLFRIFREVLGRPRYLVQELVNLADPPLHAAASHHNRISGIDR